MAEATQRCRFCGAEMTAGATQCPACGEPVVPPGITPDDFVEVFAAPDSATTNLVKTMLLENDIPAVIENENIEDTLGDVGAAIEGGSKVLVPVSRVADARAIIEAAHRANAASPDADEDSQA